MKYLRLSLTAAYWFLIFVAPAVAQIDANRLCLHNGAEYYTIGYDHNGPNVGGGKYFPSFTHISSTAAGSSGSPHYPWKINGWAWTGMQAANYSSSWFFATALQKSKDLPYSTQMTFQYPYNYYIGVANHSGAPNNVYGGTTPSSVTSLATCPSAFSAVGVNMTFPSSCGFFDQYMNIVAAADVEWNLPSTLPYYALEFALTFDSSESLLVPSSYSIWEYVWVNTGNLPHRQYLVYDGDSMDCTGTLKGNKGKNYSMICGNPG